jgi:hypothetical protein
MLVELFAILGAVGIALTVFTVVAMFSDKPVKALIVGYMFAYLLLFTYLRILEKLGKRKEEKRGAE